jgi:WD40 repeat protein
MVWDLARSQQLTARQFDNAARGGTHEIAFSTDSKSLAGATSNGVIIWDVEDGLRFAELPLKQTGYHVNCLAVSPKDKILAVAGDGGVVLWDFFPAVSLPSCAARIANRNLTKAEWQEFFPANEPYRPTFPKLATPGTTKNAD